MGGCAWAWVAESPGLSARGHGGSMVSQPGQPALWALEDALRHLPTDCAVALSVDCRSLQSGLALLPARQRKDFRQDDGQWVANAALWKRVSTLAETRTMGKCEVRTLAQRSSSERHLLEALLQEGYRLGIERDTAPF